MISGPITDTRLRRAPRLSLVFRCTLGALVVAIAAADMVAWLVRSDFLAAMAPEFGIMVFNTAACLALLGAGVTLLACSADWQRYAIFLSGTLVTTLAGLTFVQHLTGLTFGIDMPAMHQWLQTREVTPGRMAVGTSIALALLGVSLSLWPYAARWRFGLTLQIFVIFALVIAVFGLLIREMRLQFLYSPLVFSAMSFQTSLCLIAVGIGFWIAWHPAQWNQLLPSNTDEQRIRSSGTTILLAIAAGAGFFGLHASQDTLEKNLTSSQMQILRSRVQQIETVLEHRLRESNVISAQLDLQEQLSRIGRNQGDAQIEKELIAIAESWWPLGYGGVAFFDAAGREIARAGKFVERAAHVLPLGAQQRVRLSWSNGFHLRSEIDMFHSEQPVGKVVTEMFLPHFSEALLDVKGTDETVDIELCGRTDGRASCFPTRLNSQPYIYPPPAAYRPHPIYRALDGRTGNEFGTDHRGTQVFAAYAPIADYGMGLVVKIGTAELTAPIRRQLERTLPVMLLLVVAGIALLGYLVHPLAQKLAASERQLQLALDNSGLALWDWDMRSNKVYLSEQWQAMLGNPPVATIATFDELRRLIHPDDAEILANVLRSTLKSGSTYTVEHRVKTSTGEWRWIRSTGNVVERNADGRVLRMNGTNSDITLRKQDEAALAHRAQHDGLTGLPNRSLFHDRLARAMARTRRDHRLMAVMYLDIDKFKNINDTLGHAMGDELLKAFAKRLAGCVRSVDTVARLGGDEFAVILEQLEERDAGCRIAEKIVVSMRPEFTLEYRALTITTSVGVAFHDGVGDISADGLVKKADEALYAAKGAGRNNYQIAS